MQKFILLILDSAVIRALERGLQYLVELKVIEIDSAHVVGAPNLIFVHKKLG